MQPIGRLAVLVVTPALWAQPPAPTLPSPVRVVDLNVGEATAVSLGDGKDVAVRLIRLQESRDPICDAVRTATVQVEVAGLAATLESGNYRLPQLVGAVRIDCPITKGYRANSNTDPWGLVKDARLRLWPAGEALIQPGTFRYPAKQHWFASMTQMANEPVYVDGGDRPGPRKIYYHYGLDIGGFEEQVEVIAATDGLAVSAADKTLPGYEDTPVSPRYDVIYVLDARGWYYRYSHLFRIDVQAGDRVRMGQRLGLLGKEGGSGGWSHLHFDISSRQPSGKWGIQEGYGFLWEAYHREHQPKLTAVARPHVFARTGDSVTLDGSRSWASDGVATYEWTCGDGRTSDAPTFARTYDRPGQFSETLRITDRVGRVAYDFAVVQVLDAAAPQSLPPTIHAVYSPTQGIMPGDLVTFKVRTFRTTEGHETWDFGDGTSAVRVRSDGNVKPLAKDGYAATTHRFEKAGQYLVRVERTTSAGVTATARLCVVVGTE